MWIVCQLWIDHGGYISVLLLQSCSFSWSKLTAFPPMMTSSVTAPVGGSSLISTQSGSSEEFKRIIAQATSEPYPSPPTNAITASSTMMMPTEVATELRLKDEKARLLPISEKGVLIFFFIGCWSFQVVFVWGTKYTSKIFPHLWMLGPEWKTRSVYRALYLSCPRGM